MVIGRVHPGESNASYAIEGLLNNILGSNSMLLERYDIYVYPMVNPDGVRYGNYRCNMGGWDLNRNWRNCEDNMENFLEI